MYRYFLPFPSDPSIVWEWNPETGDARLLNQDGYRSPRCQLTLAQLATDLEIPFPAWKDPDMVLPEGL